MAFFDKLAQAGQGVSDKAKNMMGVASYNSQLNEEQKVLRNNYTALGEKYYYFVATGGELNPEFRELVEAISNSLNKIEQINANILSAKGMVKCEKCGAVIPRDAMFCLTCGNKTNYAPPAPPAAPAAPVCSACGAALAPGAAFCTTCGTPVSAQPAPQPAPVAQPMPMPEPQPMPTPEPAPAAEPFIFGAPAAPAEPEPEIIPEPEVDEPAVAEPETEPVAEPEVPAARFCTNCGNEIAPGTMFCTSCGKRVED